MSRYLQSLLFLVSSTHNGLGALESRSFKIHQTPIRLHLDICQRRLPLSPPSQPHEALCLADSSRTPKTSDSVFLDSGAPPLTGRYGAGMPASNGCSPVCLLDLK